MYRNSDGFFIKNFKIIIARINKKHIFYILSHNMAAVGQKDLLQFENFDITQACDLILYKM